MTFSELVGYSPEEACYAAALSEACIDKALEQTKKDVMEHEKMAAIENCKTQLLEIMEIADEAIPLMEDLQDMTGKKVFSYLRYNEQDYYFEGAFITTNDLEISGGEVNILRRNPTDPNQISEEINIAMKEGSFDRDFINRMSYSQFNKFIENVQHLKQFMEEYLPQVVKDYIEELKENRAGKIQDVMGRAYMVEAINDCYQYFVDMESSGRANELTTNDKVFMWEYERYSVEHDESSLMTTVKACEVTMCERIGQDIEGLCNYIEDKRALLGAIEDKYGANTQPLKEGIFARYGANYLKITETDKMRAIMSEIGKENIEKAMNKLGKNIPDFNMGER